MAPDNLRLEPDLAPEGGHGKWSLGIYWLGVLVCTIFLGWRVFGPWMERDILPNIADTYAYTMRGVNATECRRHPCPGLQDVLDLAVQPSKNPNIVLARFLTDKMELNVIGPPLFAGTLIALHAVGLTWEQVYGVLIVVGVVLLAAGVSIWLRALFGPGPAGIALVLLALHVFPRYGFGNVMVPSTLSLGVALLCWGLALRNRQARPWWMLGGIAAMTSIHPMGQLYGIAALIIFFIQRFSRRDLWFWLGLVVGSGVILAPLVIARLDISTPMRAPLFDLSVTSYADGIQGNFVQAWHLLQTDADTFGGPVLASLWLVLGVMALPGRRRSGVAIMGVGLLVPLLASLFYVWLGFTGDAFARLWVPAAIMGLGLVGQAIFSLPFLVWERFRSRSWVFIPWLGLASLLCWSLGIHTRDGWWNHWAKLRFLASQYDVTFHPEQPERLLRLARADDVVFYGNPSIHKFYMLHGGWRLHAVAGWLLEDYGQKQPIVPKTGTLRFLAVENPLLLQLGGMKHARGFRKDGLLLSSDHPLVLQSHHPVALAQIFFQLAKVEGRSRLVVTVPSRPDAEASLTLAAGEQGWRHFPSAGLVTSDRWVITVTPPGAMLRLNGLSLDPSHPLNWPWDQDLALELQDSGKNAPVSFSFVSSALLPPEARPIRILEDDGSTVLAEVGTMEVRKK